MFSSIPGLHPIDATSTLPKVVTGEDAKNVSEHCQRSPRGQNSAENHCAKGTRGTELGNSRNKCTFQEQLWQSSKHLCCKCVPWITNSVTWKFVRNAKF